HGLRAKARGHALHLRPSPGQIGAGPQPSQHGHEVEAARRPFLIEAERYVYVGVATEGDAGRHYPDHRVGFAGQSNRRAEDGWAVESALPESVADQGYTLRAGLLLLRPEAPPLRRGRAEHREQAGGNAQG